MKPTAPLWLAAPGDVKCTVAGATGTLRTDRGTKRVMASRRAAGKWKRRGGGGIKEL